MSLPTRAPTGLPAFPLVLLDGEEKSGKSFRALELSASPRVGRTFVFDLGDNVADEYARLGPYEVVELTGTYTDLAAKVKMAIAEPRVDPVKPNVGVLDSGDQLWDILKDEASLRARNSKKNRELLKDDPDAFIDVSMNYWNDAADRWARIINPMRRSDMIWVVTARGGFVTKVQNGQPVAGKEEWSTNAHKTLPATVNIWVRLTRDGLRAKVIGVRSLDLTIPEGGLLLPQEKSLDGLIFDTIGAGGFNQSASPPLTVGFTKVDAMGRVLTAVQANSRDLTLDEAKAEARRVWAAHTDPAAVEFTAAEIADVIVAINTPPDPGTASGPPDGDGADPGVSTADEPAGPGDGDLEATPGPYDHLSRSETRAADQGWLAAAPPDLLEAVAAKVTAMDITEVISDFASTGRSMAATASAATRRAALTAYYVRREMELSETSDDEGAALDARDAQLDGIGAP